ncbi:hypothetical protein ACILPE_01010 [Capnocytophaga canimorsus]|uniref:hypothetical protein n=1 Tax=Capnocytophaga canimorsus TaxID=28188 RepID=UPI0037CEA3E4
MKSIKKIFVIVALMNKIIKNIIIGFLALGLMACSEEKLTTFKTYDEQYTFELSNHFKKHKPEDLNFFDNGKYRIEIDAALKSNQAWKNQFEEFRADPKRKYRNSSFMTFERIEEPITNDNGYPIMAFFGGGKDRSILLPKYFEGYFFMVETPRHFVKITLKHTARSTNAINKDKALSYLIPMLKSFKEQ